MAPGAGVGMLHIWLGCDTAAHLNERLAATHCSRGCDEAGPGEDMQQFSGPLAAEQRAADNIAAQPSAPAVELNATDSFAAKAGVATVCSSKKTLTFPSSIGHAMFPAAMSFNHLPRRRVLQFAIGPPGKVRCHCSINLY